MAKPSPTPPDNTEDRVLTTAVGNAELFADTTDPRKLQARTNKNKQEK
ncbi:MAG TPA: hypothetical protein VJ824_07170 [Bacillota bacterium]|nr:hypothetical protein [Bacillota bacterium]